MPKLRLYSICKTNNMPTQLHSATSTASTLNSSNVNRFHGGSTTNFTSGVSVTPAECNSSAPSTSQTSLTSQSVSNATPFLELSSTSAADLAVAAAAAAAYDFATVNFHHRPTHTHTHQPTSCASASSSVSSAFASAYFNECNVDNFPNGLTSWEAAHQSAAAFAAQHYHGHQLSSFGTHCDLRSAFSIPSTSSGVTVHGVPTMTVQRVSTGARANSASSNASLPHQNATASYAASIISNNGLTSTYPIVNSVPKASKPRRRVATIAQRRAANIRERRRMFNLNSAFDKLRKKVPTFAYEKRLSRIETLRLAIMYIAFMTEVIRGGKDPCFEPRIPLHSGGPFQNHHHSHDIWNGNHHTFNPHSVFH